MNSDKPKRKRITTTSNEVKRNYANRRLIALDAAAVRAGFTNWRALEVAAKAGNGVVIPPKATVSELSENSPKLPLDI